MDWGQWFDLLVTTVIAGFIIYECFFATQQSQVTKLSRVLVVIICVEEYLPQNKSKEDYKNGALQNLRGSTSDKENLVQLFTKKFKYDGLCNRKKSVTDTDVVNILNEAQKMFKKSKLGYQCIMVFYSGHGDRDNVILSNLSQKGKKYKYAKYSRAKMESYFNGKECRKQVKAYKLFLFDSCRGSDESAAIGVPKVDDDIFNAEDYEFAISKGSLISKDEDRIHPEANRCIMYSNCDGYMSYEVKSDDTEAGINKYNGNNANVNADESITGDYHAVLMKAFYEALKEHSEENFSDIQDIVGDKVKNQKIKTINGDVICEMETADTLKNKQKAGIFFVPNLKEKNAEG
eukprot:280289_1